MADIQLNSVTLATESGGTVTLDSATVIPAAGVTGVLPAAVTGGSGLTVIAPTWYQGLNADVDNYQGADSTPFSSRNLESYWAYCSGAIPASMTSITDISFYGYTGQSGLQQLRFGWTMGQDGQATNTHTLSTTSLAQFTAPSSTYPKVISLMSVGSNGSYFEQLASPGDVFGFRFNRTDSRALYLVGVMITYKLKE